MRGRLLPLGLLGVLLAAAAASGAARARLGGALSVGLLGPLAEGWEGLSDSPEGASALSLLALPLCRLLPAPGPPVSVLVSLERTGDEVRLTPAPHAHFSDGSPLAAGDILEVWRRLAEEGSPASALLAPVAGLAEALQSAAPPKEGALHVRLLYPWPDFEASLCHPAFAPLRAAAPGRPASGIGLYGPAREGGFPASLDAPGGPPFPSSLRLSSLPARTAQRLVQRGELHVVLGEGGGAEGSALLYATYLVYRPGSLPPGVLAALASVDLQSLVRTFVPGPALAMHALLPPALLPAGPAPLPLKPRPAPGAAAHAWTLGYEVGLAEQRAVAERLQVILHDAGYPVRLLAGTRGGLARARLAGELEAALVSVLLPPRPAPALAMVLGLCGDRELLARELPALGALADAEARSALATKRARELLSTLPVIPLYVRGLRAQLSPALRDARRDGFGLLVLDEAWLAH